MMEEMEMGYPITQTKAISLIDRMRSAHYKSSGIMLMLAAMEWDSANHPKNHGAYLTGRFRAFVRRTCNKIGRRPTDAKEGFTEAQIGRIAVDHESLIGRVESQKITTLLVQYSLCARTSEVADLTAASFPVIDARTSR
jgi:hypothetical protein